GAVPNSINLYVENPLTMEIVDPATKLEGGDGLGNQILFPDGTSADMSVVVFESPVNLVPAASGSELKLYALRGGKVELVGYLPDGSLAAAGAESVLSGERGGEGLIDGDAVSQDGSRIPFYSFTPSGTHKQLYMRENGASTVWVSEPETSGPS